MTSGSVGSEKFFSPSKLEDRGPGFDAELASTWIDTCRNNHDSCQGGQGDSRMPTRILDLSGPVESDFVLRATEDEDGEYACLSYKWGNTNRLEASFPSLARSMFNSAMSPQDRRLPPTFRDAIKVARSIGISYLWIDALCIWQDDDDDKRLELEKMNGYYANCTVVIQASGTESVSEGFLNLAYRSRNHGVFENYLEPFPFKSSDGHEDTIYVCSGQKFDWYRKNEQPAAKRGWILQEETLCRRILIFPAGGGVIFRCDSRDMDMDDGNVFYDPDDRGAPRYWTKDRLLERKEDLIPPLRSVSGQCDTLLESVHSLSEVPGLNPSLLLAGGNACISFSDSKGDDNSDTEGDDSSHSEGDDASDVDRFSDGIRFIPVKAVSAEGAAYARTLAVLRRAGFPDTLVHTRTPPGVALPKEIHDIWKRLVIDYCARDLTKQSDKLIAIDALAREFQKRYGHALGSYHAGLWSNFMAAGLIWCSTRPAPLDAGFGMASWSWAAVRTASYPDPGVHTETFAPGVRFEDEDVQLSCFVSTEESGDAVEQIRLVATLLDVWWGLDRTSQHKVRTQVSQRIKAYWKKITKWLGKRTRLHKPSNRSRRYLTLDLRAKSPAGKEGKSSKRYSPSLHTGKNLPVRTTQAGMSQQEGVSYALFQEDGALLTREVYPDRSVDLPIWGRQSVAMMLGRRYVGGVGYGQNQHGEVLLLRKRENGTYVRIAFAELLFKDFEEVWEPRFKVETIVLA